MIKSMGIDFLPVEDQSEFEVTVRMPVGSSIDGTTQVMDLIEKDLRTLAGVNSLMTTIGGDIRKQVDRGSIIVGLVPVEQRKLSQGVM